MNKRILNSYLKNSKRPLLETKDFRMGSRF